MARHKKAGYRKASAVKKPPLTHFLCLPLITATSKPQLDRSLKEFTDATRSEESADYEAPRSGTLDEASNDEINLRQVPPKAIRPVETLHFTLGVMSLGEDQLREAVDFLLALDVKSLLQNADASSTETRMWPLKINLAGLHSMHAPAKTSILYAAPEEPAGKLHPFCVALKNAFTEKGFLIDDGRELKLHATVVNTIYAKGRRLPQDASKAERSSALSDRSEGHGPNAKAPIKIDARKLLDQYKDCVWARDITLDRLAICEMGAKKVLDVNGRILGERYNEVATMIFPVA